jgi:hypothetical protein
MLTEDRAANAAATDPVQSAVFAHFVHAADARAAEFSQDRRSGASAAQEVQSVSESSMASRPFTMTRRLLVRFFRFRSDNPATTSVSAALNLG